MEIENVHVVGVGEVFALVDGFTRRVGVFTSTEAAVHFAKNVSDLLAEADTCEQSDRELASYLRKMAVKAIQSN